MEHVEHVTEDVFLIRGARSNIYYLRERGVLIDTGMPGDAAAVQSALRKDAALKTILVTHGHLDHVGSLGALQERTGARVLASAKERTYIEGRKRLCAMPREGAGGILFRAILFLLETFVQQYHPARVGIAWPDGRAEAPGGITVVETPGHSPGSLTYFLPQQGIMVVGDALSNAPALHLPPRAGCASHAGALRSAAAIAACDFDICLFGHGEPLVGGAAARVRELLDKA